MTGGRGAAIVAVLAAMTGCAPVLAEREVAVGALGGTLSYRGGGRAAAVLLVSGSGATDRDDTLGPNKPFRDLAHGLAARGIAVLRYDPRAPGASAVGMTLREERVETALAALAVLRADPHVDPARVFVVGHSLGAAAVPRIARADARARGFVVMAGSTRRLEQVLIDQLKAIAMLDGTIDAAETALLERLHQQAFRVREVEASPDAVVADDALPLGLPAAYWRDLAAHPPAQLLAAESRPVLVLHAAEDYQVTAEDFAGWERALAGKRNATFIRYPELNHLFLPTSHAGPLDYRVRGHVAPEVIADLAHWIAAN